MRYEQSFTLPEYAKVLLQIFCTSIFGSLKRYVHPEADPGGGLRGLQPPLSEVFKLVWLPMSTPFSNQK